MADKKPYSMVDTVGIFLRSWTVIEEIVDYNLDWQMPLSPEFKKATLNAPIVNYSLYGIHQDPFFFDKPNGYIAKSMSDHGNKVIIVKSRLDLLTIWNPCELKDKCILTVEISPALSAYGLDTHIEVKGVLFSLIGSPGDDDGSVRFRNVGEWMEEIAMMMNDPAYRPSRLEVRLHPRYGKINKEPRHVPR